MAGHTIEQENKGAKVVPAMPSLEAPTFSSASNEDRKWGRRAGGGTAAARVTQTQTCSPPTPIAAKAPRAPSFASSSAAPPPAVSSSQSALSVSSKRTTSSKRIAGSSAASRVTGSTAASDDPNVWKNIDIQKVLNEEEEVGKRLNGDLHYHLHIHTFELLHETAAFSA